MPGIHKNSTVSFRPGPLERNLIEAKIAASGMSKNDFYVRSCIYNRVCVVGKKEHIDRLIAELQRLQKETQRLYDEMKTKNPRLMPEDIRALHEEYTIFLKAVLWMLSGADYLMKEDRRHEERKQE